MFIDKREYHIEIYPFIDNAKDASWNAKITISTNPTFPSTVMYNGVKWSKQEVEQWYTAMQEAFKIADKASAAKEK